MLNSCLLNHWVRSIEVKAFRTTPSLELIRVHPDEAFFKSGFCSFETQLDQNSLMSALDNEILSLEIYHNDRVKADIKIGLVKIPLSKLKECEFKKTKHSYVRIYDGFHLIDEMTDSERKDSIGELRVKIFLEDLGPIDMLTFNEQQNNQESNFKNIVGNLKIEEEIMAIQGRKSAEEFEDIQNGLGWLIRGARDEGCMGT
jgi:hypothetical protein